MEDGVLTEFGIEYNTIIEDMLWKQDCYRRQAFIRVDNGSTLLQRIGFN